MSDPRASNPIPALDTPSTELSVIVPIYRCGDCLGELYSQLTETLGSLRLSYEIILVDDESPDGAWERIVPLVAKDHRVRGLRLSRNFGQHAAITAGLAECQGKWAVVMDGDLEDPPPVIPRLLEAARTGYDIVFAKRRSHRHGVLRHCLSRLYFALLSRLSRRPISHQHGNFSLISRKVIRAIREIGDRDRHYMLLLYWLGFRTTEIEFDRGERARGESSYRLSSLVRHAATGVFFQTTVLLQWIVFFGFAISFAGFVLALVRVGLYFVTNAPPGWTTIVILQLVLSGLIITSTGVAGLYVGKIFEQVKGRPLYVISERAVSSSSDDVEARDPDSLLVDSKADHEKT